MAVSDKKKYLLFGAAAAAAIALTQGAKANLLIYEPFDYTSGNAINGQVNTYSAASETWLVSGATPLHVVGSGSLTPPAPLSPAIGNDADLKKSGTSSAYDKLNIPNAFSGTTPVYGASSTLYYSLLLDVPSITGLTIAHSNANANNDGLIMFNNNQASSASAPSSWNGELAIRLGSVAGTYNLGIRASLTDAGTTYWTGDLTAGADPTDTHFIVVQATLGATPGTASSDSNAMWLDPNPANFGLGEGSRPAPDGSSDGADSTTAANDVMESIVIGAGISTAGAAPNDTFVDEIRVGDTWADVTSVPEPSGIALVGLGLMAMAGKRRRRSST